VLAFAEELNSLLDGHSENIVNIFPVEPDVEDIAFIAHPLACLACKLNIGHELHLHSDDSFALALLAPASLSVEGEVSRFESCLNRGLLLGKKLADVIEGLQVGYRV